MGMMVDAVHRVIDVNVTDIEPPPAFGTKIRTDFMEGMAKHEEKFLILLNIDHVLSIVSAHISTY